MELNEIKKFLHSRPGYLKEGGKRLRRLLLSKGFTTTVALCKEAVRQVNAERKVKAVNKELNGARVLIYDIETSYNIVKAWRAGYNLSIQPGDIIHERKIICVSYKWSGEDQVYNLVWDENQNDKFLLEQFIEVLNEADVIVAHNGDRFDLKYIKTRALFHRLPMLINYPSIDTLKLAKKKFMFNSNRLDYISKYLGFAGKIKTDMSLWDDIILRKCPKALEKMLEYCDEDVVQLENVYNLLVEWENPKVHVGVMQGKTKQSSPIEGGHNLELVKTVTTNRGTEKHIMKDLDNGRLFEMSATNYKKYLLINK
tara:strand:- start:12603 stop:13538 length:936 start_codon:yes stop_codon:yes gene_type:complete